MTPPPSPPPDLDAILAVIHAEAARRGAAAAVRLDAQRLDAHRGGARRPALTGPLRHVNDYLALGSESLLDAAYRALLQRPPDQRGLAGYRHALRTGRRTKVEVLGRIRFSAEGRVHRVHVAGLRAAFVLALAYRVPVAGPLLGWLVALARLPLHWQDRRALERAAQEAAAESEP